MADIHGSPVPDMMGPSLDNIGSEFPSSSAGVMAAANSPMYGVPDIPQSAIGVPNDVMADARGGPLQESGYAHDVNGYQVAPYYAGAISPIYVGGDDDAGGRDVVAGSVGQALLNAEARFKIKEAEGLPAGATIGDLFTFPPSPLDPGVGSLGITEPTGGYYDPPRSY